jgi:hypothetical protein
MGVLIVQMFLYCGSVFTTFEEYATSTCTMAVPFCFSSVDPNAVHLNTPCSMFENGRRMTAQSAAWQAAHNTNHSFTTAEQSGGPPAEPHAHEAKCIRRTRGLPLFTTSSTASSTTSASIQSQMIHHFRKVEPHKTHSMEQRTAFLGSRYCIPYKAILVSSGYTERQTSLP